MSTRINRLVNSLFQKTSIEQCSVVELQKMAEAYPYFEVPQLLLTKKLSQIQSVQYRPQLEKTFLYFQNPLWLQHLLNDEGYPVRVEGSATALDGMTAPEKPIEIPEASIETSEPHPEIIEPPINFETPAEPVESNETPEPHQEIIEPPVNFETPTEPVESTETPEPHQEISERLIALGIQDPEPAITNPLNTESNEALLAEISDEPEEIKEESAFNQISSVAPPEELPVSDADQPGEIQEQVVEGHWEEKVQLNEAHEIVEASQPIEVVTPPENEFAAQQDSNNSTDEPGVLRTGQVPEQEKPISEEKSFTVSEDEESEDEMIIPEDTTGLPALPGFREPIQEFPQKNLILEPYHTVDYFASQGIRYRAEEKSGDKFAKQLKSFTEWLKMMKRLPQTVIEEKMGEASTQGVEQLAQHSLDERLVLTETMAEVWLKQGNREKAIETYDKLSLLDPSKSHYFAAKIDEIKKTI